VEFDAAWVLKREEDRGDVVGFYHTHPAALPEPSVRDVRTMRAWTSSLGKPLLCLVESGGQPSAFRFDDDRSDGVNLAACELLPHGVVVVYDEVPAANEPGDDRR
jgi:proteasome lid subunit RPN8/RPN11